MRRAPSAAARPIHSTAAASVASRSRTFGATWTTATLLMDSDTLHHERDALPYADAHRAQRVAPAGALEVQQRRGREARTGGAQRMAQRDRAAIRIHVRRIVRNPQHAQHGERLRGERLVELDDVHLPDLEA